MPLAGSEGHVGDGDGFIFLNGDLQQLNVYGKALPQWLKDVESVGNLEMMGKNIIVTVLEIRLGPLFPQFADGQIEQSWKLSAWITIQ